MDIGSETQARGSIVVFINDSPYSLVVVPATGSEARVIYRVTKVEGESYQVSQDRDGSIRCDCPSYAWRKEGVSRRGCKHIICLKNSGLFNLTWRD